MNLFETISSKGVGFKLRVGIGERMTVSGLLLHSPKSAKLRLLKEIDFSKGEAGTK
jgi:hypothetical protein